MEADEFINFIGDAAGNICAEYNLPASVCIAQAAIESGWGKYCIGNYNYFGRKWNGWISSSPSSTTNTVAFPTSYSSAAFAVVGSSTDNANPVSTYSITTTGFSYNIVRTSNVGARFICIGV